MQNTEHQGASEEPVTSSPIPLSPEPSNFDTGFEDSLVQNAVDHLYHSVVYPDGLSELHPRPAPAPIFDWGVIKNRLEVQPAPTEDQLHGAQVLENLERYLKRDAALSDLEEERRSSSSESEESDGDMHLRPSHASASLSLLPEAARLVLMDIAGQRGSERPRNVKRVRNCSLEYAYTIKVALWRHFTIHNAVGLSAESEGAGPAFDHSQTEPAAKQPKLGEDPVVIKDHLGKEVTRPPKPASGFFWRTFQWWFNCLCAEHGPPFNTES
ncbi:hypothetical protein FA13DRAFT_1713830 [Coprinellus micaceus]|uniref:Uncharacterized protein n=1 Tax=Coprinellus micaceus TaxID=71717 RepID=A0A4Y7SUM8_COPMI|nr:hypothetical protein FA13DRAFT_1713830 [Coprinellus micaceus]